jgi:hypothetical protein
MRFLGREKELESLKLLLDKQSSSIVACRGRRRIGKSTLIREFARRNELAFVNIDGLAPHPKQTNRDQLVNFILKLSQQTRYAGPVPENWFAAFKALDSSIDDSRWTVVLLDEISWMGKYDSDFAGYLKSAWDNDLKYHDKLILVVCGSVSSWINKNLLDKAEFGGRFSRDVLLRELPLDLCASFWGDKASALPTREIVDVLAVTGGVPRYLEEVNPKLSADENIKRLCFHRDGPLFKEFSGLFSEVLGDSSKMKGDILRSLVEGPMTCSEIAERLGQIRGGGLSSVLQELEDAGFVSSDRGYNPETGKRARQGFYRLSDNYVRFFLKYVEPNIDEIRNGQYEFIALSMLPGWDKMLGLAYENLVVNHAVSLLPKFHLQGVPVLSAVPYIRRGGRNGERGVQIDLLIQTRRSVHVIEVRHRQEIGEEVEADVREKCRKLNLPDNVAMRTGLVYDGRLDPVVRGNAYFDVILSSRDILGL